MSDHRDNLALHEQIGNANFLSPLWQVIYHEGIRNNHLIFSKTDMRTFAVESARVLPRREKANVDRLAGTIVNLFACRDLGSIRALISSLPYDRRHAVYLIYRQYLESWRLQIKESLH